ncbi:hypothetical protein AB9M75_04225 [Lactobacillus sp. AN1001]
MMNGKYDTRKNYLSSNTQKKLLPTDIFLEIDNLDSQEILEAARQEENREKRDLLYAIFNYLLKEEQKKVIAGGEFVI